MKSSYENQELFQKNSELIGRRFIHPQLAGSPVCTVVTVVESFPKDIVFESELKTIAGKKYIDVEFADYVREHLIKES